MKFQGSSILIVASFSIVKSRKQKESEKHASNKNQRCYSDHTSKSIHRDSMRWREVRGLRCKLCICPKWWSLFFSLYRTQIYTVNTDGYFFTAEIAEDAEFFYFLTGFTGLAWFLSQFPDETEKTKFAVSEGKTFPFRWRPIRVL